MSALRLLAQHCVAAVVGEGTHGPRARPSHAPERPSDDVLVERLLAGDEQAFRALVQHLQPLMLRVALTFVRSAAVAEEVVQDTWLALLEGLPGFAGRSSLKTWIMHILVNRARTRGVREAKIVPLSAVGRAERAPSPELFNESGGWRSAPSPYTPERLVDNKQTRALLDAAIARLPEQQRLVIELRDVAGLEAEEVCDLLALSANNQRVLLHRARDKVRAALLAAG